MGLRLLGSTVTVGGMTSISRVLGLLRDIVIARLFGAGVGMDAFIVAFRIPNFCRRLFAEGAFLQAFVPVLAEYRERRSDAEVQALLDQTAASLGLILLLVTALGILLAPLLILVFAPGFASGDARYPLASGMLRITFPYILFISLTAFAAGILNTWQRFAIPALTPALLNISLIGCAILLAPRLAEPVTALAWGVLIAGVAQLLLQLPFLHRLGKLPRPRLHCDPVGLRRILRLLVPAIYGVSIVQINLLVDTLMASFLVQGSISWLYFSDRLMEFPLGVFGVALATVILPNLAREHAHDSHQGFVSMLAWGLRWVWLIALPASLGLILLAEPLLYSFFHYDRYSVHDVQMSARSLCAYALGLPAFILVKILAAGFFSRQQMGLPVRAATIAMFANILFNLLLIVPLAHAGLALATSLSGCLQAWLLFRMLRRQGLVHVPVEGWRFFVRLLLATALMSGFLLGIGGLLQDWALWHALQRVGILLLLVVGGMLVYLCGLYLTGLRPRHLELHQA